MSYKQIITGIMLVATGVCLSQAVIAKEVEASTFEYASSIDHGFSDLISDNQDGVPKGLLRLKSGTLMLYTPIQGMVWETIKDENTHALPRIYEPFTLFECTTKYDETLKLDVINSNHGYVLKFYLYDRLNKRYDLQVQQPTSDAYFAFYANAANIIMRDAKHYYSFFDYDDDDLSLSIVNAIGGQLIDRFYCKADKEEFNPIFISQMVPRKFDFKLITDELEMFISKAHKP